MKEGETGAAAGENQATRSRWRLGLLIPLYFVGGVFAFAAVLAVLAAWRLSEGPVPIGFLTPYLQESIGGLPEGWRLEVGETAIAWDGAARTVNLTADNVTFVNRDNQRVLQVPEMAFSLWGDALLQGNLRPREVTARGVSLLLTRTEDGGFAMGLTRSTEEGGHPQRPVPQIVAELFGVGAAEEDALRRVRSISLVDSRVRIVDQVRDRVFGLEGHTIRIRSAGDHLTIQASVDLSARDLILPLWIELDYRPEGEQASGLVRFEAVRPPELVTALDAPDWLAGVRFPVSGEARFGYSARKGPEPLTLRLYGGEGEFDLPGHLPAPVPVAAMEIEGAVDIETQAMEIRRLVYDAGAFVARAEGRVRVRDIGPDLDLTISGEEVPGDLIGDYWPLGVAEPVRDWVTGHVRSATAERVVAALDIAAEMWGLDQPPGRAFDIDIAFRDATVTLYPPFDPITQGRGELTVTGDSFELKLESGRLGDLALSDGHVAIESFAANPPVLTTEFVTRGTIAETVASVLHDPIAASVEGGGTLLGVGGTAATRVRLNLPIHAGVSLEDTDFVANANLTGVVADGLLGDLALSAESMALSVDRRGAELAGRVHSGASWLDINWIEHFGVEGGRRELAFSGQVQSALLADQGIDQARRLQGPLGLSGRLAFQGGDSVGGAVEADLSEAALEIGEIGWRKPAGEPGRLGFLHVPGPDGNVAIRNLDFHGGGLDIAGSLMISGAGDLLRADLERARLGGNDLALSLVKAEDGAWRTRIRGASLDLQTLLEADDREGADLTAFEGAAIDIAVDSVRLRQETALESFTGDLRIEQGMPVGRAEGLLNGEAALTFAAGHDGSGWRFDLASANAGLALSAAGLTDAISGGDLSIGGVAAGPDVITGVATVSDFTLRETPGFARLLSLASFTGIAEALSGRGLSFSLAELPFAYREGRVDVRKGRMVGPSIGLTAEGYYAPQTEQIRFVGNLIPAYSISQVLGAIPLLGQILGGDQGLFGVTYVVEGDASDPQVTVNPLSALAPGILRRMFLAPVDPVEATPPPTGSMQSP
ncbi:AsmA-like C-terminal domain-containing protein [Minwuia thermotolerans]|uniref:YhdP family protein n=1 Tax=Minwuia thermotolerans TaxID=2056226 RepID=UPI0013FE2E22|nr:AsmA-like C-terminal domain-containing protein [Minwuia thermotolerans]